MGQSVRRRSVLCDSSDPDNTTTDTRYQYVDPPDVTLKNLDLTDKGSFYVSCRSNDTDESTATATFTVTIVLPRSRLADVTIGVTRTGMRLRRDTGEGRTTAIAVCGSSGRRLGLDSDVTII